MVMPAVLVSKICSYCLKNLLTSVDVPPISNPITGVSDGEVTAKPMSPPAGPDKMAREPINLKIKQFCQTKVMAKKEFLTLSLLILKDASTN